MIPQMFRLQTKSVTNSTNDDVKLAALAGEAEGYVVQAFEQKAGRGRHGRVWESPRGNLYVSVLLRPRCTPTQAGYYSFATAMAVYDAVLDAHPRANIQLKWPNDVLIRGKKISGILIEAAPCENGIVDWIVIGVGINVANHPDNMPYPATSLMAEGVVVPVHQVLESFLRSLDHWHMTLRYDGFRPVRRAWLADAKLGAIVVRVGTEEITGNFGGLDERGGLILCLLNGGERVIDAGDVFYIGEGTN
ncbi:MAG: biotin--[acetyl-CoA-carboxylase] ligase [Alphaproteobacteria bacterium]|jgi:BirA family biotin operon repressor/biotin-[acetyl-CoA-carboxylase] ligase|nr:biotin--[acetyl-CoA-carboxylase] ligase [Alphaproteobacteria bacterium]